MADLIFAQSTRRNYTGPIVIALVLLGITGGLVYRSFSHRIVSAAVTQTKVRAVVTVYKRGPQAGGFTVLKRHTGEKDLYIIPTVRIENHLTVPLFLKDFTITMTTTDGEMHTSAIEENDLPTVYSSFPDIKQLMTTPLLREAKVEPGKTIQGTLLAQFAIPQNKWEQRQSATLTIDLYHQPSMTIPIPKP